MGTSTTKHTIFFHGTYVHIVRVMGLIFISMEQDFYLIVQL